MSDPSVDPELERICLRCLSRPMCERYLTAADLAADLKRWLDEQARRRARSPPYRSFPRDCYAFDVEDARFFLALLPGPRRGDGLPESIRFWKDRIEVARRRISRSAWACFTVLPGAGSRRSSRRACFPNLDQSRVRAIFVEATPTGTEARLLDSAPPRLPIITGRSRPSRPGRNPSRRRAPIERRVRLLVVLDQFEQWLQAHAHEPDAQLVRALRQCDGRGVSALVVVRDDFWMAVTRFLQAIEVPLLQGSNAAAVELFDAPACSQGARGVRPGPGPDPQALKRRPGTRRGCSSTMWSRA